jgi:hypothetical protein
MNAGYGSVGAIYGVRAWANFNSDFLFVGEVPVPIRQSANISSIIRFDTGRYQVNFTTAMSDTRYSVVGSCKKDSEITFDNTDNAVVVPFNYNTTYFYLQTSDPTNNTFSDPFIVNFIVVR